MYIVAFPDQIALFFSLDLISRLYYQDLAAQNIQTSEIFRKKREMFRLDIGYSIHENF